MDKKYRAGAALLLAGVLTFLTIQISGKAQETEILAWWGTIYPKFCYMQTYDTEREVKISFWLAKAFNW